jgi:hypothetical protein
VDLGALPVELRLRDVARISQQRLVREAAGEQSVGQLSATSVRQDSQAAIRAGGVRGTGDLGLSGGIVDRRREVQPIDDFIDGLPSAPYVVSNS